MSFTPALLPPVFIWHAPPSHNITASLLSLEHNRFITGSDKGHVLLWNDSNLEFEPQVICFSQSGQCVAALEVAPFNERECVASVSTSGHLAIWSLSDGQCQVSTLNAFKCSPTCLKLLPDRRHLAASGRSPVVEILDLMKMEVVRIIAPHSDWICGIGWAFLDDRPMLISLSLDNILRVWHTIEPDTPQTSDDSGLALITMPLIDWHGQTLNSRPNYISISPSGHAILVVHEKSVHFYTTFNVRLLFDITVQKNILHADWVDDLTVLVWINSNGAHLYRLPRSTLPQSQPSPQQVQISKDSLNGKQQIPPISKSPSRPVLASAIESTSHYLSPSLSSVQPYILFKRAAMKENGIVTELISATPDNASAPSSPLLLARLEIPGHIQPHSTLSEVYAGCVDNFAYLAFGNGQVLTWIIPTSYGTDSVISTDSQHTPSSSSTSFPPQSPISPPPTSLPLTIQPCGLFSVKDGWDTVPSHQMPPIQTPLNQSSTSMDPPSSVPSTFVTASRVWEEKLLLISGFNDGTISLGRLPIDSKPRSWQAHQSRINAFLLICTDTKEYLVSASADFFIKVWDVQSDPPVMLHSFANHCGPVRSLFVPDPSDTRRKGWDHRFFSIGEDRIVGLFEVDRSCHCVRVFPNHPSSISEVKWRPDEDYLVVLCKDGSVTVWEMESGQVDSTKRGNEALSVLSLSRSLSRQDSQSILKKISKQSVTGVSIPIENESPVQALLLNIKNICHELHSHIKHYQQYKMKLAQISKDKQAAKEQQPQTSTSTSTAMQPAPVGRKSMEPSSEPLNSNLTTPDSVAMLRKSSSKSLSRSSSNLVNSINLPIDSNGIATLPSGVVLNPKMTLTTSATQLGAYRACAYLLPWNWDAELDKDVTTQLLLNPPNPPISYGMIGYDGSVSVLVPKTATASGRFRCSDTLAAIHSLSSVAASKSLLSFDVAESDYLHEHRSAGSSLMTHFCVILPEKVEDYKLPSLATLAAFWQDPQEDIQQASRVIFSSVLNRLSHEQRRLLAIAWSEILKKNTTIASATTLKVSDDTIKLDAQLLSPHLRYQAVLILAILGCDFPESLPTETAANVALELLEIMFEASDVRMRVTASELFSKKKGFALWSKHLPDETGNLIQRLIKLAVARDSNKENNALSKVAANTLKTIATKFPSRFVEVIYHRFSEMKTGAPSNSNNPPASPSIHSYSQNNSATTPSSSQSLYNGPGIIERGLSGLISVPASAVQLLASSSASPSSSNGSSSNNTGRDSIGSNGSTSSLSSEGRSSLPAAPINAHFLMIQEQSRTLILTDSIIKNYKMEFYPEIRLLGESIVRSLNPHVPDLRSSTQPIATILLNHLVERYPMIGFDPKEQRLAIGTSDGFVDVYDLNSAVRLHTLNCHHPHSVSAVAFAPEHKVLATYSVESGKLKVWKANVGLFGLISGEPQMAKSYEVPSSIVVDAMNPSNTAPTATPSSKFSARPTIQRSESQHSPTTSSTKNTSSSSAPATPSFTTSEGSKSLSRTPSSKLSSDNPTSVTLEHVIDGLKMKWESSKTIRIDRGFEIYALAHLEFTV